MLVQNVVEMDWTETSTLTHDMTAAAASMRKLDIFRDIDPRPDIHITCLPCQHWCVAQAVSHRQRLLRIT